MVVGFVVFIYDSNWVVFQIIKFGHLYPGDLNEMFLRLGQNLGFLLVCYCFIHYLFEKRILEFQVSTYDLLLIQFFYFVVWFVLAKDPSWTDWTYALRNDYPGKRVIGSFIISHFVGKLLQGLTFVSLWRKPRG